VDAARSDPPTPRARAVAESKRVRSIGRVSSRGSPPATPENSSEEEEEEEESDRGGIPHPCHQGLQRR
jgi:hypothetical protein